MAVHVLSAVALYEAAGHRVVLTALEELYYFHCSAPAASSSAAQPFKLLVDELRKPRSRSHAHRLTLINAIVSGCPEIGTRVRMRGGARAAAHPQYRWRQYRRRTAAVWLGLHSHQGWC